MRPGSTRRLTALASVAASVAAFGVAAAVLDPALRPVRPGALSARDEQAVRETLALFQKVYQDFYASGGNPGMIDSFPATKDVKHHVFRDIGFVRDGGFVLVQDLATATLVEARRTGPDTAEAVVHEEWNYVFQKRDDRKPLGDLKGLGQGFVYGLRRERGRWIVTSWDLKDVARPAENEGFKW